MMVEACRYYYCSQQDEWDAGSMVSRTHVAYIVLSGSSSGSFAGVVGSLMESGSAA